MLKVKKLITKQNRIYSKWVFFLGLLLQGDDTVQLVVLCAEKPTSAVLKRVVHELPIQLKKISEDSKYTVTMAPVEGAVLVTDGSITVKVSLTSPLLREPAGKFKIIISSGMIQLHQFQSDGHVMKSFSILSNQFHKLKPLAANNYSFFI